MGVLKFQVTSPDPASRLPDLRKAYVSGLDRTPARISVEFRQGVMACHRESNESGRLFVPWPVEGFGTPIVGTATLIERRDPYNLAVELARGKLNEVRNQLSDWTLMGLRTTPELDQALASATASFIKAATAADDLQGSYSAAQASLAGAFHAGRLLVESYTGQVLQTRLAASSKLTTQLAGMIEGDPKQSAWAAEWSSAFNAARIGVPWKQLAPSEGQYAWDELDAQLAWIRKAQLPLQAGPLIDFRPSALPDWIWLWEGDFETILGLVADLVRVAVQRYRGKIPVWHLVHRPASTDVLGLTEEEQIRISARAIQVARQVDPAAQYTIGVERPWAEWMGSSAFQLGPLHLADYLVRADLGLAGIAIEVAPGYSAPGSHIRDLFDFSKLLDLYALLNLPLHVWLTIPSASGPDVRSDPSVWVESAQWPRPPDPTSQAVWAAQWIALAVAKPYVRSVSWSQTADANYHLYPHGGLFHTDGSPKPLLPWLKSFRREILA
jgi:hypothetical protein